MSKYTTEVRFICEELAGLDASVGYTSVNDVISKAIPKIFDFNFPIFDENYRNVLETKILKHFYTREIGLETYGLWKLKLDTLLNEIMPYYNQLYKSELLEFNPLYDVDVTTTHTGSGTEGKATDKTDSRTYTDSMTGENAIDSTSDSVGNDNRTTTNRGTGTSKQMYSDTPQGAITDLESGKYLTNATINNATSSDNGTDNVAHDMNVTKNEKGNKKEKRDFSESVTGSENSNIASTEKYVQTVRGKQGGVGYSDMLLRFRDTFINIDMMVIRELEPLFMQLW